MGRAKGWPDGVSFLRPDGGKSKPQDDAWCLVRINLGDLNGLIFQLADLDARNTLREWDWF
jgi:hypothetical protein